jgi:hypothetical protein
MAKAKTRARELAGSKGMPEKEGFAHNRSHAALSRLTTSRWSRLFGYGVLIFACRVVRTLIHA